MLTHKNMVVLKSNIIHTLVAFCFCTASIVQSWLLCVTRCCQLCAGVCSRGTWTRLTLLRIIKEPTALSIKMCCLYVLLFRAKIIIVANIFLFLKIVWNSIFTCLWRTNEVLRQPLTQAGEQISCRAPQLDRRISALLRHLENKMLKLYFPGETKARAAEKLWARTEKKQLL